MKELSIEEKAKAYDEALEVLHKYDGANIMFSQSLKEEMFPELKESEDEMIRKAQLDYWRSVGGKEWYGVPVQETITWLEKQGESDETKAKIFLINNGYPIDSNGKFPTYEEMYYIIKDGLEKQGEQNPAWSEEDEEIHRKCICAMRASACGFPEEEKFVEQFDNWLKSLKDRVQPKQEYSEEDKTMLCYMEGHLEYLKNDKGYSSSEDQIMLKRQLDWLKSLKDRYTWKPSEGQLECLGYAIEKAEKDWSPLTNNRIYLTLKALKEQLEKL